MTGATGAVFSVELLRRLRNEPDVEIHLVLSPWARTTIHLETRLSAREVAARAVARPPTVMILIRSPGPARRDVSMVVDVGSGRVADRRQPAATGLGRGGLLLTAALGQPARVVRPPGAVRGLRVPEPFLRIRRAFLGHLVPSLLVPGRVHHRGDVPAG